MARYEHAVMSGRAYATAIGSVAAGTVLSTTASLGLFNPIGSGVNLVIWKVSMGYGSGTLGAGFVGLCANTDTTAAATTGTPLTIVPCFFGNPQGIGAKAQAFGPATLPVAPGLVRPLWSIGAQAGGTAVQPQPEDIDLSGEFVVAPGATLSIEVIAAAGAGAMIALGIAWAEIPLEELGVTVASRRA